MAKKVEHLKTVTLTPNPNKTSRNLKKRQAMISISQVRTTKEAGLVAFLEDRALSKTNLKQLILHNKPKKRNKRKI